MRRGRPDDAISGSTDLKQPIKKPNSPDWIEAILTVTAVCLAAPERYRWDTRKYDSRKGELNILCKLGIVESWSSKAHRSP